MWPFQSINLLHLIIYLLTHFTVSRGGDTRTVSGGIRTSKTQTDGSDPQGNPGAQWDRPHSGGALQPYVLHEQ